MTPITANVMLTVFFAVPAISGLCLLATLAWADAKITEKRRDDAQGK